jgi:hypothetical protein
MPYTPTPNDALIEQSIAAKALTQLNLQCVFPKTAVVDFEKGAFERGNEVKIRRPKRRRAQNIDPRGSGAGFTEAEFFKGEVTLDNLWYDGFDIYKHDGSKPISLYIKETAEQSADAICQPNEEYLYSKFRTWTLPATGVVRLGDHAPIAIVASVGGNNYAAMDNTVARNALLVMEQANVPNKGKIYHVLSSKAKSDYLGDATVLSFAGMTADAGDLIKGGLRNGEFLNRYGFDVTGSNVVGGQAQGASGTNSRTGFALSAAPTLNNDFVIADMSGVVPVGVLGFVGSAAPTGFAQGQIVQIRKSGAVIGHGVLLRINGNTLSLAPYDNSGALMIPAQFDGTETLSVPFIPSVSPFYHQEALLIAQRFIQEPSEGSGAKAVSLSDADSKLTMQVMTGNFDMKYLRERNATMMLNGGKVSDWRKAGLTLTL